MELAIQNAEHFPLDESGEFDVVRGTKPFQARVIVRVEVEANVLARQTHGLCRVPEVKKNELRCLRHELEETVVEHLDSVDGRVSDLSGAEFLQPLVLDLSAVWRDVTQAVAGGNDSSKEI